MISPKMNHPGSVTGMFQKGTNIVHNSIFSFNPLYFYFILFLLINEIFTWFQIRQGMSLEHDEMITEFYQAFMHENALNPAIFPALR